MDGERPSKRLELPMRRHAGEFDREECERTTTILFSRGNEFTSCGRCGAFMAPFEELGQYRCRFHPGLPVLNDLANGRVYTCCGRDASDPEDLGCRACDHDKNVMQFTISHSIDLTDARGSLGDEAISRIPKSSLIKPRFEVSDGQGHTVWETCFCVRRFNDLVQEPLPYEKRKSADDGFR